MMGVREMQSHETFPCVTDGRVYERELGKVWQSILESNSLDGVKWIPMVLEGKRFIDGELGEDAA